VWFLARALLARLLHFARRYFLLTRFKRNEKPSILVLKRNQASKLMVRQSVSSSSGKHFFWRSPHDEKVSV
jgi:hypothetical protein